MADACNCSETDSVRRLRDSIRLRPRAELGIRTVLGSRSIPHPFSARRCAVLGAHLGNSCAPSKESSGFSKMRTLRIWCASSNEVRTFQGAALDPVPMTRKVAQPRVSALIALCCFETNVIDNLAEPARKSARRFLRLKSKICGIGVICGSLSLTTNNSPSTEKSSPRNPWSGFILD
jgi:hypothetical protein